MPSFTERAKQKQNIQDLYDIAKKKGLTTWELNFLKSVKDCLDGKRTLTPSMEIKLKEIATGGDKRTYRDDDDDLDNEGIDDERQLNFGDEPGNEVH